MNRQAMRVLTVTAAIAVGTWLAGWWSVPVVALLAGALSWGPASVALGSTLAWALLLVIDAVAGSMSRLAGVLADVMGLPAPALIVVTLLFPALLGWSAATIGAVILSEAKERVSPSLRSG